MKHLINPQVDCVFKSLLGAEENKALLINFLNAVLTPPLDKQIIEVTLLNPYNKREFINDKSTIVDIKAKEQNGHLFQIEIQLQVGPELPARMAYTWADIYHNQLGKGDGFYLLQPIVSIWLLGDNLKVIRQSDAFHHCFKLYDPSNQVLLTDHCQIHTLELKKWGKGDIKDDIDYWSWLFSQGDHLDIDHLPSFMTGNPLMRQAVETIRRFSEKERDYHLYQSRVNYLRLEADRQHNLKTAQQELKGTQQELKGTQQELQQEREEKERLRELLHKAGVNPD